MRKAIKSKLRILSAMLSGTGVIYLVQFLAENQEVWGGHGACGTGDGQRVVARDSIHQVKC